MRVHELIKELKKYSPNSEVGIVAHDNLDGEISGFVIRVWPFDPEKSFDPEYCRNCFVVLMTG